MVRQLIEGANELIEEMPSVPHTARRVLLGGTIVRLSIYSKIREVIGVPRSYTVIANDFLDTINQRGHTQMSAAS